jgi:hypothetical protein
LSLATNPSGGRFGKRRLKGGHLSVFGSRSQVNVKCVLFGDEKVAVNLSQIELPNWSNCLYFLVSMWSERQESMVKASRQKKGESHENFHGCSYIGSIHCARGDVCPNPDAWRTRL